ncbi:MAG: hypothetical protein AB8B60_17110 [Sulfitobacter sp.]
MIAAIPAKLPNGAALWRWLARPFMNIILHIGAHRTATTTFQHYLRDHTRTLARRGIAYWGPEQTRTSVFPGLFRRSVGVKGRNISQRAAGRARMLAQQEAMRGASQLLISDENLLGTPKGNLRTGLLYAAAGERIARVADAFGDDLQRIVLSIRSPELWWASAAALAVSRSHPVPKNAMFNHIAQNTRSWREVITDIACAAPDAEILVVPFERSAGQTEKLFTMITGEDAPVDRAQRWLNRSDDLPQLRAKLRQNGGDPEVLPDAFGRWQPFTTQQAACLRENYADDLHWLTAGADGLAKLTEDLHPTRADTSLPPGALIKGQGYDKGQMAQHR